MEGIAPPLELLLYVKRSIEGGRSVKAGVLQYVQRSNGEFPVIVTRWLGHLQQGLDPNACLESLSSPHRKMLLRILERGMRGETIYPVLIQLEEEIIEACYEEVANKVAQLPIIMMVPLLLFQFPAFLLLLFGPLMQNFFPS